MITCMIDLSLFSCSGLWDSGTGLFDDGERRVKLILNKPISSGRVYLGKFSTHIDGKKSPHVYKDLF